MTGVVLREAGAEELPALSALCLRSKGHWGHGPAFLAACRAELTLTAADLATTAVRVAAEELPLGVVQLAVSGPEADLVKLFLAPEAMGRGIGRRLFRWAEAEARRRGARRLRVEADPRAVPFYERMGARVTGAAPSRSIPGRMLPAMVLDLG